MTKHDTSTQHPGRRVPGQVVSCGWCGRAVTIPARGRVPKWCSATCRHRAWEQRRALASGRTAIEVVDREVAVAMPSPPVSPRTVSEWNDLLKQLTRRLDAGRIYDRDLPALSEGVSGVLVALDSRLRRNY